MDYVFIVISSGQLRILDCRLLSVLTDGRGRNRDFFYDRLGETASSCPITIRFVMRHQLVYMLGITMLVML